jgi:hypothetical protein
MRWFRPTRVQPAGRFSGSLLETETEALGGELVSNIA